MARTVLFVADSDSNLKFATAFGRKLAGDGLEVRTVFVGETFAALGQAANAIDPGDRVEVAPSLDALFAGRGLLGHDVIFVLVSGHAIRGFCARLELLAHTYGTRKPVTVGGFIGEWISSQRQVAERAALDLFVVNRADELEFFRGVCATEQPGKRFVALPYGFLVRHGFTKAPPRGFDYRPASTILFADQVQVPRTHVERARLYQALGDAARATPGMRLIFCTREVRGGVTRHRALGGVDEHLSGEALAALPNVTVEYGSFRARLPEADLVLSVSSTAGVEALMNGVPALFLTGFASSGVEKFAHTGLTIDISELLSPKSFATAPEFHDQIARTDVWDEFSALVRGQPGGAPEAVRAPRAVVASLNEIPSAGELDEEIAAGVLGLGAAERLDAPLSLRPLHLADAVAAMRNFPAAYAADLAVAAEPRIAAPAATIVPTRLDGYAASAAIGAAGRELSVHVPMAFGPGDRFELEGESLGEAFKVVAQSGSVTVAFSDPSAIQLQTTVYPTGDRREITAFRLRSFVPLEISQVRVEREIGQLPPTWFAWRPSFLITKVGQIAPAVRPGPIDIPAHPAPGRFVVLSFERDQAGRAEPLIAFRDEAGHALAVEALTGPRLAVTLERPDGETIRKVVTCPALAVAMSVIATPRMTIVMMNESLLAFEAPFTPRSLAFSPAVESGLSVSNFAAFAADIPLAAANALVEQILVRRFSDPVHAWRHRPMPDFRAAVEARLGGKPPPPAAVPTAPPPPAPQARAEPAGLPAGAAAAAPTTDVARVMRPYLDLVAAGDLAEAATVGRQSKSPLLFSQRFLRAGEFGKALAVSALALDQTPGSKAHLMICAEALAGLGAPDRAETYLKRAETLAPNDPAIRARAAAIRGTPAGPLAGVGAFIKRAFGR